MTTDTEPKRVTDYWWIPVLIGGLTLATGIFVMVYPDISLKVLAIATGFNMILIGGGAILSTIGSDDGSDKTLLIVVGVLTLLAGIIVARRPEGAVLLVVLSIGIWLVLAGIADLAQAFSASPGARWAHVIGGLFKLVVGTIIVCVPDQSVSTLAILAGIGLVVSGLGGIVTGLALRAPHAEATATA